MLPSHNVNDAQYDGANGAEFMRTEMHGPRGPYLAFGLLLTPRWLARPITDQIEGHAFAELDCADAARVLEGVVYLQWIKAGIVGGISLLIGYAARDLSGPVSSVVTAGYVALMMWLPLYMISLSVPWAVLRRSKHTGPPVATVHPWVLRVIRLAPLISAVAALAFGILT
jgi:hypothetical protein